MLCVGSTRTREETGVTGNPEWFRTMPMNFREIAMTQLAPHPALSPVSPGQVLTLLTDAVTVRTGTGETHGTYALYEYITPPGGGFPPHRHHYDDMTLVVLDGTYSVLAGARTTTLTRGDSLLVPRGTVLGYLNPGTQPSRLLVIVTPGYVHEQFLADVGDGAGRPPWEADMARILAVAPKYGIEFQTSLADEDPAPSAQEQAECRPADGGVSYLAESGLLWR